MSELYKIGETYYSDYSLHSNGLYLPYAEKKEKTPIGFDFFSGCGGFSLGFMQAGIQVMGACELDFYAVHSYLVNLGSYPCNLVFDNDKRKNDFNDYLEKVLKRKRLRSIVARNKKRIKTDSVIVPDICGSNFSQLQKSHAAMKRLHGVPNMFIGDIREFTGKGILKEMGMQDEELDVICGGPPCQGFSKANREASPYDPRNVLVFEYARKIVEMQPKTFVMEEVPNILNMHTPDGIPVVDAFCRIIADGGFAGYDAIRHSLMNTPRAGVAFKGSRRGTDMTREKKTKKNTEKKIYPKNDTRQHHSRTA